MVTGTVPRRASADPGEPLARGPERPSDESPPGAGDRERLRRVFRERDDSGVTRSRHSWFNPAHVYTLQERERALLDMLRRCGYDEERLGRARALSLGCGTGTELLDLVRWGARSSLMVGVDVEPGRLRRAKRRVSDLGVARADAAALPLRGGSFDLVMQFTLFTSVLDPRLRRAIAIEMLRVLAPGGMIVWYDFWPDNPANPNVRGIRAAEIRRLFPGCRFGFRRLTLPPPLARRIVPLSRTAADLLARIEFLKSFHLVSIHKSDSDAGQR